MYITFLYPAYLYLFFILPLFIFIHFWSIKYSKRNAIKFANFEAIAKVKGVNILSKNITLLVFSIIIGSLIILSMAGATLHFTSKASSFSFMIAIDSSRSMEAKDLNPNRLEAAKTFAKEFIDSSPYFTRAGVLSFSGNTYIYQEITDKKSLIKEAISSITISEIDGTDLYECVLTGTNLLFGEDSRSLIILSDGQINAGEGNLVLETISPEEDFFLNHVINYANNHDVMIHSILVGTKEGGTTSYGTSKVYEDSMKALSYNTGGEFIIAENDSSLRDSFQKILNVTEKKVSTNLSGYILIVVLILFILEYILMNTKYRNLP